jgi:DNA polymerase-3 subunit gamma/tau
MGAGDDEADPEIAETARLAQAMPADETQLLYSLCLHGRGELGLAPDEYAALTMVLLRLLAFKPSEARASVAPFRSPIPAKPAAVPGSAAEPEKKPQPERPVARLVEETGESAPALPPGAEVAPSPLPLTIPAVKSAPELAFDQENESNQAHVRIVRPQVAINSVASTGPQEEPMRAPVSAPAAGISVPHTSLGDAWSAIVNQLVNAEAVAALTRELALQSELCSQDAGVWTLRVERESLSQPAAREKLQAALQTSLSDPALTLAVQIGAVTDTPARRNAAALAERQREAEALIQNDPFVQDMIRDWGARIVPGSIKSA